MYRYLDHPSEEYVEVQAETAAEVFCEAGRALFDIMTDVSAVRAEIEREIHLQGERLDFLLVEWLNQLIFLHETHNLFFSKFQIDLRKNGEWEIAARVSGETVSRTHERRAHAKSATYGQLEWQETASGYLARFVIDI